MVGVDPDLSGALLAVAAGVLLVAGLAKLRRPKAAAVALRAIGLGGGLVAVRMLAAGEVAIGLTCLIRPRPAECAALAAIYVALAGFVLLASRLPDPPPSCGCSGTHRDPPPHPLHALIDLILAGAGMVAALGSPAGLRELAGSPALAVPLAVGLVASVALVLAALETLPVVLLAYRPLAAGGGR